MTAPEGPNAKPARMQTMPDGSYLIQGAAGINGISMKLTAMASATNNAYMAMRCVDQRPRSAAPVEWLPETWLGEIESGCEKTLMRAHFFHPDYNRWPWTRTRSTACAGCGLRMRARARCATASKEFHLP